MTYAKPAPRRQQVTSAEIAAKLINALGAAMDDLLALLEQETALIKTGRLSAAAALAPEKEDKAAYYTRLMLVARDEVKTLAEYFPADVEQLKHRHERFRAEVQINLAVLATARDVAQDLMRTVASEVGRTEKPSVYGNRGQQPTALESSLNGIAVNRSL